LKDNYKPVLQESKDKMRDNENRFGINRSWSINIFPFGFMKVRKYQRVNIESIDSGTVLFSTSHPFSSCKGQYLRVKDMEACFQQLHFIFYIIMNSPGLSA